MTHSIFVLFLSSFFSIHLVSVHLVESTQQLLGKKLHIILSDRFDINMINNQLIAGQPLASPILMWFSVDEALLSRYMNLSTNFREPLLSAEMSLFWLKHFYSVLYAFTSRLMPPTAWSRLFSRDLAWVGVFARSAISSVYIVSVIVCGGYRLLLAFFSVKLFSLIRSIDLLAKHQQQC